MTPNAWFLFVLYLGVLALLAWPLSHVLARLIDGELPKPLQQGERLLLGSATSAAHEMDWYRYALAVLTFNLIGVALLYLQLRLQDLLPLNPQHLPALNPDLAFNTAISFVTNTNWQAYSGEATMSYLSQMLGLTVHNFLSAATGLAVAFAFIRGLVRHSAQCIGNAWVDLFRVTVYVLLPLCCVLTPILVQQGTLQNLSAYVSLPSLAGQAQTLPMGPVASQEAIKMLGTNGGGFFNANSAHPFENPTALTNFLQMLAIFVIPAALVLAFGRVAGDRRQGVAILAAMTLLFVTSVIIVTLSEQQGTSVLASHHLALNASDLQPGGNMEGKESRFGIAASALFSVITTAASCGAVNAMLDSMTPLSGFIVLLQMQLGEVIFGGVGAGFYGMALFVLLTVFVAGLMIGRTPEYLGKKIESAEMKLVALGILVSPFFALCGTALAVVLPQGLTGMANPGAHGFTEVLYAYSSAAANNGSAFAGLSANTPFYNLTLGIVMFFGRFGVILPVLAMAGTLAGKKRQPEGAGTLPTHGPLFIVLLVGSVLLVGALTFIPSLALGPIVEHLMLILK